MTDVVTDSRTVRYSFSSTGWLDPDWVWQPAYDRLSACGKPTGDATGAPAPTVYTRAYERCAFKLDCSNPAPKSCVTTITWPGGEVETHGPRPAAPLGPKHGRAYYDSLER